MYKIIEINKYSTNPEKYFGDKEFIYVDIESIKNGTGIIDFSKTLKGIDAPSRARRLAAEDNILISTVRPNLKGFAYLKNIQPNTVFSTGYAVLEVIDKTRLLPKFLFLTFMFSNNLMNQIVSVMEKSSYPSINQDDIYKLLIALPPLDIQKEIVLKFDTELLVLDKLRQMKTEAENKVKQIIDSVWEGS